MMSLLLLPLLLLLGHAIEFSPESGGLLPKNIAVLPSPFNLTTSQTKAQANPAGSFWSSSFVHGSDSHDYLIISHLIVPGPFTMYRFSILDITDTSRYEQREFVSNDTDIFADNGRLSASFPSYGFESLSTDVGSLVMRTWSSVQDAEFDLSFELSSPVLLNGGLGFFQPADAVVYQWSMPAGKTSGWLNLGGSNVTIDTQDSLTWYDRQWGGEVPFWTWFEIHVESGGCEDAVTPISVWSYDTPSGPAGFATIREANGVQTVVPLVSLQPSNRTYVSEDTGMKYPLDWTLKLADETTFYISSPRDDQEMHLPEGIYAAYEGYVTLTGTYRNGKPFEGYGVVEMYFGSNSSTTA